MVGIFVGNTDNDWFDFLASQSRVDEANFWKPSPTGFRAIQEGERFAFRLKAPRNKIGGFGILAKSSVLPIQTAWDAFGTKNGVTSLESLVEAISRYRPGERVTPSTFIGCRVLVQPVFLPPQLWLDLPESWSSNIMGGKRFSTDDDEGERLWENLERTMETTLAPESSFGETQQARFGVPTLVSPRLGQGAFRVVITELYGRQCALTDGKVLPALDAAHIRPYAEGGTHTKSNGILLRKDIHSVFDSGYATIDQDYRFVVSELVRDVFHNGNEYRRLHGTRIRLPPREEDRPDRSSLLWHNEKRYLG